MAQYFHYFQAPSVIFQYPFRNTSQILILHKAVLMKNIWQTHFLVKYLYSVSKAKVQLKIFHTQIQQIFKYSVQFYYANENDLKYLNSCSYFKKRKFTLFLLLSNKTFLIKGFISMAKTDKLQKMSNEMLVEIAQ